MEAPEKLFVAIIHPLSNGHTEMIALKHGDGIEYIHKDAFIKKACELLARMIWEVTYEDLEGNSVQHYDKMEFIEDFKNYMKGE